MNHFAAKHARQDCPALVRVWCWDLRERHAELEKSHEHLSRGERRRLAGIVSAGERRRFLLGRYALRAGLSECVKLSPPEVRFRSNRYGQLRMTCESGRNWFFSLSHSGNLIYVAAARGVRVGVDVERLRPRMDCESVGELCLSRTEQRQLQRIPAPERRVAFHRMWCGKEALVKAAGKGMHIPLHTVHVGVPAEAGAPVGLGGWTLEQLGAAPGYVAALAVESPHAPLVWMVKPA